MTSMQPTTAHPWRFFRAGGFDQVRLETAADLLALEQLDQKLWVALSCPVQGIEFDARTLSLMDSDANGQLRANELLAAIRWTAARLADPEVLVRQLPGVPLAAIHSDGEGAALLAAARTLLAELGQSDGADALLSVDQASDAEARSRARLLAAWEAEGATVQVLGEATAAAQEAIAMVSAKIDDYFARCRLAAFDPRAAEALNADAEALRTLGNSLLAADSAALGALPLARIEAGRPLPLGEGLNPAWAAQIAAFAAQAVTPLLGARRQLSEADWAEIQQKLAPYGAWLAARPEADDLPELASARDLERLARYVRDLLPLANNFVAFHDFYTRQGKASFQVGTLYLDGRSAELCIAVADAAKHAALAGLSGICLLYCDCRRKAEDGSAQQMSIAAAFTAGDATQLMVGRNGVFYDRQGRDWDATIVRIVDHPISLRQAFWSPYRRLGRLIAEQLQKLAANKANAVEARLAESATGVARKADVAVDKAPATPAQQAFDVGKFAGIFAAIGLAVGALGTAVASLLTGLLGLRWWQLPLALAGLLLVISGPAMVLAWFKLRQRNLGPLLDANGWAINARARINIPFGTSLTGLAQLPAGALGSLGALADPYADKPAPWGRLLLLLVVILGGLFSWWKLAQ